MIRSDTRLDMLVKKPKSENTRLRNNRSRAYSENTHEIDIQLPPDTIKALLAGKIKQTDRKIEARLKEIKETLIKVIYHTEELEREPYYNGNEYIAPQKIEKTRRSLYDNYDKLFEQRCQRIRDLARDLDHNQKAFENNLVAFLSYVRQNKSKIRQDLKKKKDPNHAIVSYNIEQIEDKLKKLLNSEMLRERKNLFQGMLDISLGRPYKATQYKKIKKS